MKTNIFNITAIVLLATSIFVSKSSSLENDILSIASENLIESSEILASSYTMVSARVVNGEILPVVELPELTISADYNKSNLVKAKRVDGELIPMVDLPELTIVSE
jgi:hypothetical protein